jgi:hypothetical protein
MLGRSEQGREETIEIRRAYQGLAMGECVLHGRPSLAALAARAAS